MKELAFKLYSVLKNEDAIPYIGNNIIVIADGLGGSGSAVHPIDRQRFTDLHAELMSSTFSDFVEAEPEFYNYLHELLVPMIDAQDDTSALWASRIVIARCVYALEYGEFKNVNLSSEAVRDSLTNYIASGLSETVKKFNLQKGKYDDQLLLPTTLAFMKYTETETSVTAETLWAGDSRCYALTIDGLKVLSIDDEDKSGSITNLFYADNKKTHLNYRSYEINKPCILFAVSDGAFDPFDPNDNFGLESILLDVISVSNSIEEVNSNLYKRYKEIHSDDVTIAFVPFGFSDFYDLKRYLEPRTKFILELRNKQAELHSMLEVANQTEEDATHYVSTRTNDKYDYIIYELVKAFESGNKDIAITNEILKIIESVQKNYVLQAEKARKHHIAQAIDALCEYVKTHPEKAICEILNKNLITISDDCDNKDFANLKKIALEINSYLNSMQTITHKMEELAEKRNSLHFQVLEKINFYRSRLDQLWYAHSDEEKRERSLTRSILHAWDDADMALFNNWDIQNIGNLPQDDKSLVSDIKGYISEYKQWRNKNNDMKYAIAKLKRSYTACWAKVSCLLKKDNRLIEMLLSNEILIKFDLNVSNENFVNELNNGKRNQIITELKAQKDKFVKDIVKSLADNYTQTSIIDSQYNPTKLELFRTYYRLKNNPNTEIKTFEKQLTEVEAMYNSFVK